VLKSLRALHEKKARREAGQFLAEGLRICTEALAAGHTPATLVFTSEAERHPLTAALIAATADARGSLIRTTPALMEKLTGKANAQGLAAAYPIPDTSLASLDRSAAHLWLVGETIRDPGNIGTMLRTTDGAGAGGLMLLDTSADPFSTEAVRASMGAIFSRRLVQASGEQFFHWLRQSPAQLTGAALAPSAIDYRQHRWQAPAFLLVGNEQAGLPPTYTEKCDALVKLPMHGTADSLNVAVAAGILLYAAEAALS
jgi:TrmH family RNA methyltransferase